MLLVLFRSNSQAPLQQQVEFNRDSAPISWLLEEITSQTGFSFAYKPNILNMEEVVVLPNDRQMLKGLLDDLSQSMSLNYTVKNQVIILKKNSSSKRKVTLSGFVREATSGEDLIAVHIVDTLSGLGTISNYYGFFSLTLPVGPVAISASYVGFERQIFSGVVNQDTTLNFSLNEGIMLEEVEILSNQPIPIDRQNRMSVENLRAQQIETLPTLGGETDVMKVIQLMPGVQGGQQASSGFYVRGGNQDQNLILLDGAPVYNSFHLFGFLSVFNSRAISSMEFIKGDFPARYSGRLSSVLDIKMREGNNQSFHGSGTFGLITSNLTFEGPLKKGKGSFIVSGRRTYLDLLARPFLDDQGYFFHDFNVKLNYRISDRDRILYSFYTGLDQGFENESDGYQSQEFQLSEKQESELEWGNNTSVLRWNHLINNQLFSNVSFIYSDYHFRSTDQTFEEQVENGETTSSFQLFDYQSEVKDLMLKVDLDYSPTPQHDIKIGAAGTFHRFLPGVTSVETLLATDTTIGREEIQAWELNVYVEDEIDINDRLSLNAGIHGAFFEVNGTLYQSFQPRLSGNYHLGKDLALKASYSYMTQFLHLLTNAGIGLPTDLWVPATDQIRPQNASQWAIGLAKSLSPFDISLEGYYKNMTDVIEYQDGASFLNVDNNWQNQVLVGDGESYGVEFTARKNEGVTTGWIGYTWSRSYRTFEEIDDGQSFPFRYDRRHKIDAVMTHKFREGVKLSANWTFASGAPVTLPTQTYVNNGTDFSFSTYEYISGRNSFRLRDTHRLDLSLLLTKVKKKFERTWIFSLYNAYGRRNPFYIERQEDLFFGEMGEIVTETRFIERSFFPIIPSVSYQIKF